MPKLWGYPTIFHPTQRCHAKGRNLNAFQSGQSRGAGKVTWSG
jgi:hypothetical protein